MRTDIPQSILDAWNNPLGVTPTYRATVYKNRVYFDSGLNTFNASYGQGRGIQPLPLSQDLTYCPALDKILTVYSSGGYIYIQIQDKLPVQVTGPQPNLYCRPSVWSDNTGTYIAWYDSVGGNIQWAMVDTALVDANDGNCLTLTEVVGASSPASVHIIHPYNICALYISDGGVKAAYHQRISANNWQTKTWPNRFMHPTFQWDASNNEHLASLNFSGALWRSDDKVAFYLSMPDGNVMGVEYKWNTWSNTFEAVPADLSVFKISKVLEAENGTIHMVGQFQRVDPVGSFSSPWVYNLDLWSRGGRYFSIDRFSLFALGDDTTGYSYRFLAAWKSGNVFFSDAGRYLTDLAPFSWADTNAERLDITANDLSDVMGGGEWRLNLRAGDEVYRSHPMMKVGNILQLEIGVLTVNDIYEYFQVDQCIIASISKVTEDGNRDFMVEAISESLWRASVMTHPFYLEIQSKQSIIDDMEELDNLYTLEAESSVYVPLVVDFWDNGNNTDISHVTDDELTTAALNTKYTAYPEIGQLPIEMKIYGWSRSGGGSPNDTGGGTNDTFHGILNIIKADDSEVRIDLTTPKSGESLHPPQTWSTVAAGYYPVTVVGDAVDGLEVGDRIKSIGVSITPPNQTTFYVERVEIPQVVGKMSSNEEAFEEYVETSSVPVASGMFIRQVAQDGYMAYQYDQNFEGGTPTTAGMGSTPSATVLYSAPDNFRHLEFVLKSPQHLYAYINTDVVEYDLQTMTESGRMTGFLNYGGHFLTLVEDQKILSAETIYEASGIPRLELKLHDFSSLTSSVVWTKYTGYVIGDSPEIYLTGMTTYGSRTLIIYQVYKQVPDGSYTRGVCDWHYAIFEGGSIVHDEIIGRRSTYDSDWDYDYYSTDLITIVPVSENRMVAAILLEGTGFLVSHPGEMMIIDFDLAGKSFTRQNIFGYSTSGTLYPMSGAYDPTGNRAIFLIRGDDTSYSQWVAQEYDLSTGVITKTHINHGLSFIFSYRDRPLVLNMVSSTDFQVQEYDDLTPLRTIPYVGTAYDPEAAFSKSIDADNNRVWVHSGSNLIGYSLDDPSGASDRTIPAPYQNVKVASFVSHLILDENLFIMQRAASGYVGVLYVIGSGGASVQVDVPAMRTVQANKPQLLFATKPYSTFGFKVEGQFEISGTGAWAGALGLARDGDNYVMARISIDTVEIVNVKGGVNTVLATTPHTLTLDKFWLLFEHMDGHFSVRIRENEAILEWSAPLLTYDWTLADGPMAADGDLLHVGLYAMRQVPYVQITGYSAGQTFIGVLPPGGDLATFPASGILNINGSRYNYTGKVAVPAVIGGPYQGRNTGLNWSYSNDGQAYSGNSVEATRFEWVSNSGNHSKFSGAILSVNNGINWQITETDFKPYIKSGGSTQFLRNRARFFSPQAAGDQIGMAHKVWITQGFSGVSPIGEAETHYEGDFAYLDTGCEVILLAFSASSDHEDATVEDMIDRMIQLSGGEARFPGDVNVPSQVLTGTEWRVQ